MKTKLLLASIAFAATAATGTSAFAAIDNIALGKTTTASSFYDSRFPSAKVTDGIIMDSEANLGFWLAAQGKTAGEWVQVDLGDSYQISNITLFDTHNRAWNDRGTNAFTLALSSDGTTFSNIASGAFTNAQWLNQSALSIDPVAAVGRYLRFNVASGYGGSGAGLAEIQVSGSLAAVPEPASYAMLLAGMGLMVAIARRRRFN